MVARCVQCTAAAAVRVYGRTHTHPCTLCTAHYPPQQQPVSQPAAVLRFFDQGANETRVNDGAVQHMTHEGDTTQTRNSPL